MNAPVHAMPCPCVCPGSACTGCLLLCPAPRHPASLAAVPVGAVAAPFAQLPGWRQQRGGGSACLGPPLRGWLLRGQAGLPEGLGQRCLSAGLRRISPAPCAGHCHGNSAVPLGAAPRGPGCSSPVGFSRGWAARGGRAEHTRSLHLAGPPPPLGQWLGHDDAPGSKLIRSRCVACCHHSSLGGCHLVLSSLPSVSARLPAASAAALIQAQTCPFPCVMLALKQGPRAEMPVCCRPGHGSESALETCICERHRAEGATRTWPGRRSRRVAARAEAMGRVSAQPTGAAEICRATRHGLEILSARCTRLDARSVSSARTAWHGDAASEEAAEICGVALTPL